MKTLYLNFKTYPQATGKNAIALARVADEVALETGKKIVLVVQATDIRMVAEAVSLEVYAQHIDATSPGATTGSVVAESIKTAGARGTILNHAEKQIRVDEIKKGIERAKEINLKTMVCAETAEFAKEIAKYRPDAIAVEPPELIGGTVSVTMANPKIITDTRNALENTKIPFIVGAGINSAKDITKSFELGAEGVFVASAVIKSGAPKEKILEFLKEFP
jgi:triosephosphate isomerase (TIM)